MPRPATKNTKKRICDRLALGEPIQEILTAESVTWTDVVGWLKTDGVFAKDYELSRKYGADYLADQMLGINKLLREGAINATTANTMINNLKWQTMVRDNKYNERVIIEQKNVGSMDPDKVTAEIERLKKELSGKIKPKLKVVE